MDIKLKSNLSPNSDSKIIDTINYNGKYINVDVFKKRALSVIAVLVGLASVAAVVIF